MRKVTKRLNYEDRIVIEKLMKRGMRVAAVADIIGVHRATIYKELKRGGVPYDAETAQKTV